VSGTAGQPGRLFTRSYRTAVVVVGYDESAKRLFLGRTIVLFGIGRGCAPVRETRVRRKSDVCRILTISFAVIFAFPFSKRQSDSSYGGGGGGGGLSYRFAVKFIYRVSTTFISYTENLLTLSPSNGDIYVCRVPQPPPTRFVYLYCDRSTTTFSQNRRLSISSCK